MKFLVKKNIIRENYLLFLKCRQGLSDNISIWLKELWRLKKKKERIGLWAGKLSKKKMDHILVLLPIKLYLSDKTMCSISESKPKTEDTSAIPSVPSMYISVNLGYLKFLYKSQKNAKNNR